MASQGDSALARWSRLKREAEAGKANAASRSGPQTAPPVTEVDAAASGSAATAAAPDDEFRIEDLPEIDTLNYQSDFTAFMRRGVPAALQQAALSKLWRSDPVFACQDGLTDIGIDFRTAADIDPEAHVLKLLEPQRPEELALTREERLPQRDRVSQGERNEPSHPSAGIDDAVAHGAERASPPVASREATERKA